MTKLSTILILTIASLLATSTIYAQEHSDCSSDDGFLSFPSQNRVLAVPLFVAPIIGIIGTVTGEVLKDQSWHLGNSAESYLQIENQTDEKLTIEVSEVDNHDWDGDSRPDHEGTGFQNASIDPQQSIEKRQEMNAKSSTAMSTMKFFVDEEERFDFRVDQWNSYVEQDDNYELANGYNAHFVTNPKDRKLTITITRN